jgi:hypothetical protein
MLHVIQRRVREHALLTEQLYVYVGKIMNKQKKTKSRKKKKVQISSNHSIVCVCAH